MEYKNIRHYNLYQQYDNDLKTTFTLQQILVLTLVAIALLFSGFVGKFYNLENEGVFLEPKAGERLYHLRQKPKWAGGD